MEEQMEEQIHYINQNSKQYECPKHGNVYQQVIKSDIPGLEGRWCLPCALEKLIELGVHSVKEIQHDQYSVS
jgi:hypothetical protein